MNTKEQWLKRRADQAEIAVRSAYDYIQHLKMQLDVANTIACAFAWDLAANGESENAEERWNQAARDMLELAEKSE